MTSSFIEIFLILFCILTPTPTIYANYPALGTYNGDPYNITTSGFSSGGAMSVQFHYAYSNVVKGAGVFAGFPYLVASGPSFPVVGSLLNGLVGIQVPSTQDVQQFIELAKQYSSDELIDPVSKLNGSNVYIYQGNIDPVVKPGNGPLIKEMYQYFGANIKTKFDLNSTHGIPTDNYGLSCGLLDPNSNGVNNCTYEGVFDMFSTIYGSNNYQNPVNSSISFNSHFLYKFDQNEFFTDNSAANAGMSEYGYVYVPRNCQMNSTCRVHVAFHGCVNGFLNELLTYSSMVVDTGYLQVADVNDVIIIFPQATLRPTFPVLTITCWDFYGYTGTNYAYKSSVQLTAIYKMVKRVSGT